MTALTTREATLLAQGAALESAAYAKNTRRAYDAAWVGFEEWCRLMKRRALPADLETVRLYLIEHAGRYQASSLELHVAAIRKKHRDAGHPLDLSPLAELRRGIRRSIGTAPRRKKALTDEHLVRILGQMGGSLADLRDRVILLLGFVGGMRRSEIAGLDVEDLEFKEQGVLAHLRRSKGDQEGQGAVVELKAARRAILCPVRALRDWLGASGIQSGPLLRGIDRFGFMSEEVRFHATSINAVVKKRAAAVGINKVSAHSLRAGAATTALAAGAKLERVAKHLRHKSIQTTLVYDRQASRFKDNAMELVLDAAAPDDPLPPVPLARDAAARPKNPQYIEFHERADMPVEPLRTTPLGFKTIDLEELDAGLQAVEAALKKPEFVK
ncbi:MAG: tyrosine-type recombinase/integrase [Azospirillum sp.]|nr:tyrosine-type recombinase/integrase [Azospirillum sp.]